MGIENFVWDKQNHTVSWFFDGEYFTKSFKNMYAAFVNNQENFILLTIGKNFITEQVYYISFDGEELFEFDKTQGNISWHNHHQTVAVDCKNSVNAIRYFKHDLVLAIVSPSRTDQRIIGYAADGIKLFEKEPPEGYVFRYLSFYDHSPSVVCDGGIEHADKYGRSEFHFKIDTKSGDMVKVSLSY